MLSERRMDVWARALWREWVELRYFAANFRVPPEVQAERFRAYFRRRFAEAADLLPADSTMLAEVLCELMLIVNGQDEIEGVQLVALKEALSRITVPLCPDAEDN